MVRGGLGMAPDFSIAAAEDARNTAPDVKAGSVVQLWQGPQSDWIT